MRTSKRGKISIISHEAIVLTRYKDSANIWTIGVGVTSMAKAAINPDTFKGEITVGQAIEMFGAILPQYERGVDRALAKYGIDASQNEYDALVSECYNLGSKPIDRFCQVWKDKGKDAAASKMMEYVIAGGKRIDGLVHRRRKEVSMFLNGDYGSGNVSVYTATKSGNINWKSGRVVNVGNLAPIPIPTPRPEPPVAELPVVPDEVHEVLDDQDKGFFASTSNMANIVSGGAGTVSAAGGVLGFIESPWVQALLLVLIAGGVFWLLRERSRKAQQARVAKASL